MDGAQREMRWFLSNTGCYAGAMMQLHGPNDLRGRHSEWWEERGSPDCATCFWSNGDASSACAAGTLWSRVAALTSPTAKAAKMMMRHQTKARLTHLSITRGKSEEGPTL